ncbi:cupin domain-containing protein [Palleronia sp. LCG004]|uniref:cupin domain-containing protein n=1 Tax=Palleronia sp. LCG004 TaxID=3079304 RepID=UPI00294370DF|nr:cupin domain-containing protein [Palleronia sp. LCG004]WOI57539.1 cupin domain-containing protein [Palleronia sp. LCG004]
MTDTYPEVQADPGVTRRVLSQNPEIMVVGVTFEAGAEGKPHDHPHTQAVYVEGGRFRFTLGDDTIEIGEGESLVVPSGTRHGVVCLEAGRLIDTFTPRRDDFL